MGVARVLTIAGSVGLTLPVGCSLALEKLKAHCEANEDCHALNVAHQLDDGPDGHCEIYQCRRDRAGCELRERDLDSDGYLDRTTCQGRPLAEDCNDDAGTRNPNAEEMCNGEDDNCNGVIDEGALSDNLETFEPSSLDPAEITSLSYTRGPDGHLLLALTSRDDVADRASTALLRADTSISPWLGSEQESCAADCKWWEVAVAASEDYLFGAGINGLGCRPGLLRLGIGKIGDPAGLTWNGSCPACAVGEDAHSNISAGVDVLASSPNCSTSGELRGASAPSLAVLTDAKGQPREGLVLWRAGPASAGQPLPLVGLSLDPVRSKFDPRPVIGLTGRVTHSASLQVDPSAGREPAVIQASRAGAKGGYFVAYDSQRGVELAFLPADAASVGEAVSLTIASAGVTRVALVERGEAQDGARELALTFRLERPEGDRLALARVRFDARPEPALTLVSCAILQEAPKLRQGSLVAVTTGFADPSRMPAGGLFVIWIEPLGEFDRLMAARVPEQWTATAACSQGIDDQLLEPPFVLAQFKTIAHAFTFSNAEGTPSYGFISRQNGQQLNRGELRCRPTLVPHT